MKKGITVHELKTWPQYWEALESGAKTFEVRKLDRLFGVGDTLHLREWSPTAGYSGREMKKTITYLMAGGQWGLSEGNCILGIKSLLTQPADVQERAKEYSDGQGTDYPMNHSYRIMVKSQIQAAYIAGHAGASSLQAENERLRAERTEVIMFLTGLVSGYDCESDFHKYQGGNGCRVCDAQKLLNSLNNPNPAG